MNELRTKPGRFDLGTTETNKVKAFNAKDPLADEGPDTTIASAVAEMFNITTSEPAPAGAIVGSVVVQSPEVLVTFNGSVLTVDQRYRVVVTYISSNGNTEAMETEIEVPF